MFHLSWFFFFFKQKTAYEMRISDWSSDVCSSDLAPPSDPSTPPSDPTAPPPGDTATPPADDSASSSGAATPEQVAQIVNQEFPTYDADTSGDLSETEFATWMTKLRTATDPTVDPQSEQVKTWIGQAFAAADADKSGAEIGRAHV